MIIRSICMAFDIRDTYINANKIFCYFSEDRNQELIFMYMSYLNKHIILI